MVNRHGNYCAKKELGGKGAVSAVDKGLNQPERTP